LPKAAGAVGGDPAYGGMGMPKVIGAQVEEMVNGASLSFGLYPMLTPVPVCRSTPMPAKN
jgi:alkylation response protein AidB-like acyl-CoA dehydrogenase